MNSYEAHKLLEILESLKTQYQETYILLEEALHDLRLEQLQKHTSREEQLPFRDEISLSLSKGR